jgi:hypothetical protein
MTKLAEMTYTVIRFVKLFSVYHMKKLNMIILICKIRRILYVWLIIISFLFLARQHNCPVHIYNEFA